MPPQSLSLSLSSQKNFTGCPQPRALSRPRNEGGSWSGAPLPVLGLGGLFHTCLRYLGDIPKAALGLKLGGWPRTHFLKLCHPLTDGRAFGCSG